MKFWFLIFCTLSGILPCHIHAENIRPVARFSKDVIKVGEPVKLSLTVKYVSALRVLLPDTNHSFAPFELLKKEYYPTKTQKGISFDSVIYFLSTFSLDTIQTISVPVFQFSASDSTEWMSEPVSIKVQQIFKGQLPNKPVFETQNSVIPIPLKVNYPYAIIGVGALLILILALNFFFNRPIQRYLYLFLEKRRHDAYIKQFERINQQMNQQLTVDSMERLLNVWKKYLQRVDGKPYTTYTSMEIFKVLPDSVLKEGLQEIDRWIYGGVEMKAWTEHIDYMKTISLQLYSQKRETIRNGKFD